MRKGQENLIPNKNRTPEELREITKKGGIASGIARNKKKNLRELTKIVLDNKIQDNETVEKLKKKFPELDVEDVTYGLALILKQYEKAKDGDSKAFEIIRDTSGQKPVDQQEIGFMNGEKIEIKIDGEEVE